MKLSTTSALSFLLVAGKMSQGAFADKIRFMKFGVEGTDEASCKEPIEYPIDAKSAKMLREDTNAISVMLPSEGCSGVSFDELTESLGHVFPPTHPDDENSTYWKELKEVAFAVSELKKYEKSYDFGSKVYALPDPLPTVMPRITNLWNGIFDIVEVAKAVQDEFPGVYHAQLITKWLEEKSLDRKPFLFQTMNNRDFLRFPVMLSDMVGHAIRMVGPCDFALKWFVGRARPEEVAWKIRSATGKSLVVPPSEETNELIKIIDEMEFSNATEYTAYVEGSPNHPSYPAMHSAHPVPLRSGLMASWTQPKISCVKPECLITQYRMLGRLLVSIMPVTTLLG